MKYVLVAAALFMMSCAQQSKPAETTGTATAEPAATTAAVTDKLPDPVCEMPYDTSYQEWTVYKTDTLHFCSSTCKEVFLKAPDKYMAKLGK
ncbi:YHS domain-containing protein [Chitinophaga jiangningensis]|uniref:YHS domain-containing protein n=1 Tax=Chitinophaga jiangningensis TaxID=1419482 RepID=A0A1M6X0E3_9BACT|nr:YHS domain-containing protein [Chitinophaga jiangningensis]SHK99457.1 YHS domain-containing protein [Chitinophaga jiangningensis]